MFPSPIGKRIPLVMVVIMLCALALPPVGLAAPDAPLATYTEPFDTDANWVNVTGSSFTAYGTKEYYNPGHPEVAFHAEVALRENSATQDGFPGRHSVPHAWRLRNEAGSFWQAKVTTGGVGAFSVWVRRWDASPDPDYVLEYSVDNGANWTSVQTINNAWLGSSDWKQVTGTINASNGAGDADDIVIRIRRANGERLMVDDFEMTDYAGGAADSAPAVSSTTPAADATNIDPAADISISFSEDVTVTDPWFDITCATSGSHAAAVTGGPQTFTLNPALDFVWGEVCTVTIAAGQVADVDTEDPPDNMEADYVWSFTVITNVCDDPYIPIYEVQGSGDSSPYAGASGVDIEGIVVGDFQGANGMYGFYVQDPAGDGSTATSDGVFVYVPAANPWSAIDVQVGDEVHVEGTVKEYNTLTEFDNLTALKVCGSGSVAPTLVDLPEVINGELEQYEGMLITIPETLTVSQNYFQGRYGEVTLSADGRMYNPTNGNGLGDTFELNARRILVLDDGYSGQNPAPIPYIGVDNTLRAGDTVAGLTGTLDYGSISSTSSIRDYRLQPTQPVSFARVNARPAAPEAVGGNVRVATFNTLNWFYTIDPNTGSSGFICGPLADQECRGADSVLERDRQLAKLVAAITGLNADVVGLMEIESTGIAALSELVDALNAATAAGSYAYVTEPAPGDDVIKVSLIYKPAMVTPAGAPQNYQTSTAAYDPLFDRPPLAQAFSVVATGEKFTVVVNHFKSKGCDGATGADADQGDGQSCWNAKRVAQSAGLLDFIASLQASSGDDDVITIGDYNAYSDEDPIVALEAGGLIDLGNRVPAASRYSYIFDGFSGELDHTLATASLDAQVTGATIWHINADEPSVIDYNTEFKPQDLYAPDAYRASDHDPVLVGLGLFTGIAGFVFIDDNGNGWRDAGETSGLPGVTVVLEDAQGNQVTTHTMSSSGWYGFYGLSSGVYTLRVLLPEDYMATSPTQVTITVGDGLPGYHNFGVQARPRASIGDFVWDDTDADGVQDPGEAGLAGVTLALWSAVNGAPGAVIATTTTGLDGRYSFGGLARGSYFVQVTDDAGILAELTLTTGPQSMPNPFGPVAVDWGQAYMDADFGYAFTCGASRAAISGRVWQDSDRNGQQDAGEPGVADVTVCAEPLSYLATRCVQTNPAGVYRMCLRRGTYLVAPVEWPDGLERGQWRFHLPVVARPGSIFLNLDFDLAPAR